MKPVYIPYTLGPAACPAHLETLCTSGEKAWGYTVRGVGKPYHPALAASAVMMTKTHMFDLRRRALVVLVQSEGGCTAAGFSGIAVGWTGMVKATCGEQGSR